MTVGNGNMILFTILVHRVNILIRRCHDTGGNALC